jgi:hypothetical protein
MLQNGSVCFSFEKIAGCFATLSSFAKCLLGLTISQFLLDIANILNGSWLGRKEVLEGETHIFLPSVFGGYILFR